MPSGRPQIQLSQYQIDLVALYHEGLTFEQLSQWLYDTYNIRITSRTIKRRFRDWKVTRRLPTEVEDIIKNRIQVLFFEVGLEDTDLLKVLHDEGYKIGKYTLVRLRFELGLRRRVRGIEQSQQADALVQRLVTQELGKGIIDGYGRGYLYTYFRQRGHIIGRDRLFRIYCTMNPDAVARRKHDLQRHRGEYIVPGPNFVWSIDGYQKLKPYGIEIYACIDAYSRYIVWIYIGISGTTAISCLRQFLDTLEEIQQQPRFVRSDRGTETVMLADAHHQLQSASEPGLQFEDCYLYGTSTANQRIEAWWQQLSKGLLFHWRNYFAELRTKGHFSKDNLADQISLYAIFIPILREELYSFVRLWNSHSIRKQKNRPNAVVGKPFMLYHYPGKHIPNCALSYDTELFRTLKERVESWDIDAFLPLETLEWCNGVLASLEFDSAAIARSESRTTICLEVYLQLRLKIQDHVRNQLQPTLALLQSPIGAWNWQGNIDAVQHVDLETDISGLDEALIDPNLV